jgi:hypothetical protein
MSKKADKRGKVKNHQLNKKENKKSFSKTKKRCCASHANSKVPETVTEWSVKASDSFCEWWDTLSEKEQIDVAAVVGLLEKLGPMLEYPYSSKINSSKYSHLRELRIQHAGRPYRVLYAFDPRRTAILLVGGDKTGDNRWYPINIPLAEGLYKAHLRTLE